MPGSAEVTAARILAAAVTEFSEHGLAGGRVDRIARAAAANIRMIYAHFGSKERLFEAALDAALTELAQAVPIDEADLPEWAGRVFDHHRSRPQALRLSLWRELERPQLGPESTDMYAAKLAAISSTATAPSVQPLDLLVLLFGMAQAWWVTPGALRRADSIGDADARIARHRHALVTAARALCSPSQGPDAQQSSAQTL